MRRTVKACEAAVVRAALRWDRADEDYRAVSALVAACIALRLARKRRAAKPRKAGGRR